MTSVHADRPQAYSVVVEGRLGATPSRWLWLVKWLLALPHYLVVGVLVGAGAWSLGELDGLVLIVGVALLMTGAYPRALFDLVLGINRWALRVAAYVLLTTDRYPALRLDQGGDDPGELHLHLGGEDVS